MRKWVLVSPEASDERGHDVYFWSLVGDGRGGYRGAGITDDLSEAATFETRRATLQSTALSLSAFIPKRVDIYARQP